MDSTATLDSFLTDTDLCTGRGFFRTDWDAELSARETHLLDWGKLKIDADALFVHYPPTKGGCFPLAYFRRLEEPDPALIAESHRLAWNMGQAPLLFIVLPGKVRVYTSYERPSIDNRTGRFDDKAGLIDTIDFVSAAERWRHTLKKYNREELLSGRFWEQNKARFSPRFRIEKTLLANLSEIRDLLLSEEQLSAQFVHSLLGRAIFIQYLQDRKDTSGRRAFPEGFFNKFKSGAEGFTDVLAEKKATYNLFRFLEDKFNGDIFPVEPKEERLITRDHLTLLAGFLRGDIQLPSKQLAFWPYYSFDAIPIEFISNLYEEFFHFEKRGLKQRTPKSGTFYTPHRLVDFLMDEVLPWEGTNTNIHILDPACGSAIFLVEAYRRLIARWQNANPQERLSAPILKGLMTNNIYGVDSNPQAIHVAAFSLYLTMCDYLEPRYIWNNVKFPFLRNKNLWVRDFFDFVMSPPEEANEFDLVIGNPPWESRLSLSAGKYLQDPQRSYPIGDNQIGQAFLWAAADVCKKNGEIVLIAPSKGLLFNISNRNRAFREKFFSSFEVRTIINLSALRRTLFPKAVGPAAPIFYSPTPPDISKRILYCCPKPCYSPEDNWHFIIEPQDISYIPVKQAIKNQYIWKTAMWGTPRDWEAIQKLSILPSIQDVCESRGWVHGEGYIIGLNDDKKEEAPWLTGKPHVTSTALVPYHLQEEKLPKLRESRFYRSGKTLRQIYKGPHLLIGQSPRGSHGFVATLLRNYAVFSQAMIGISAPSEDEDILGAVCLAINSKIPLYYAMLTSGRWLVERDELAKEELMSFPLPKAISEGKMRASYDLLHKLSSDDEAHGPLHQEEASMYGLTDNEMFLVQDTIEYTLEYFWKKDNSNAVKEPTEDMLKKYGQMYCKTLNKSFGQQQGGFSAKIFSNNMPMIVAQVALNRGEQNETTIIDSTSSELTKVIKRVDQILLEEFPSGVFIRRNLRIYDGSEIYLIKRDQRRFWTISAAFRDADETYADIMRSWRI